MGVDTISDVEALQSDRPDRFPIADMIPPSPFQRTKGPESIKLRTPDSSFVIDATSGTEKPKTPVEMGRSAVTGLARLVRGLTDEQYNEFATGWKLASAQERLSGQAERPGAQTLTDSIESVRFLQDLRAGGKPVVSAQPTQGIRKTG